MAYPSPKFSDLMHTLLDCGIICFVIKVILKIKYLNEINNNDVVYVTLSVLMLELLLFPV